MSDRFERFCQRCGEDAGPWGLIGLLLALLYVVLICAPIEFVRDFIRGRTE